MAPALPAHDTHHCTWRSYAETLHAHTVKIEQELHELKRKVFGHQSEKMPSVHQELRRRRRRLSQDRAKRRSRKLQDRQRPVQTVVHHHLVPDAKRHCPSCGNTKLRNLGRGDSTSVLEYVPAHLVRHVHIRVRAVQTLGERRPQKPRSLAAVGERLCCPCGSGIITAPSPDKVFDKSRYGPGLMAHIVTSKCADSMPHYRLAKRFARMGIRLPPSTLVNLFHRTAELLQPLTDRILSRIAENDIVYADETPMPVIEHPHCKKGYLWTFVGEDFIGYTFSLSRSGAMPSRILGDSRGTLVVDGYTGYNSVTTPKRRKRAGCWCHARRKFFKALSTTPQATEAMGFIRDLYAIEYEALDLKILGTRAHQRLRASKSALVLQKFNTWLQEQRETHLPKGPLGQAISYALKQWSALTRFLGDARICLDNNISERALRVAALGRKNFLFVGHEAAGQNMAGLYTLVMSCLFNEINPQEYLADVLMRIQTHKASRLDELLPDLWHPPAEVAVLSTA